MDLEKDIALIFFSLLVAALGALCAVVILFFRTALNKLWGEIKSLREVRHDDTDQVTEVTGKLTIMEYVIKDLRQELRLLGTQVKMLMESKRRRRDEDDG